MQQHQIDWARTYRAVFSTAEGQKVLDDIMSRCQVDMMGVALQSDLLALGEWMGRRNLGLQIAQLVFGTLDDNKPEVKG